MKKKIEHIKTAEIDSSEEVIFGKLIILKMKEFYIPKNKKELNKVKKRMMEYYLKSQNSKEIITTDETIQPSV